MGACYCTGRCTQGGTCAAFPNGRPGPFPTGRTHREPLTEEQVRQIIREELKRAREGS